MTYTAWRGLPTVIKNLNDQIALIKGRTLKGLIRGSSVIKETMDSTPPTIPVDTGNMRHSWFTVTNNGGVIAGRNPSFVPSKYNDRDLGRLSSDHARAISEAGALVKGKEPAVALGFSAYYTMWVHENIGATFTKPGSGAKFFESAVKASSRKVLDMIRMEAKIR